MPNSALLTRTHLQPVRIIDPVYALMIDGKAFAAKHNRQPSITKSAALHRDCFEALDELRIVDALRFVLGYRSGTAR